MPTALSPPTVLISLCRFHLLVLLSAHPFLLLWMHFRARHSAQCRWSQALDCLTTTFDSSTTQWCKSNTHPAGIWRWILNLSLFPGEQYAIWSSAMRPGSGREVSSQPARPCSLLCCRCAGLQIATVGPLCPWAPHPWIQQSLDQDC